MIPRLSTRAFIFLRKVDQRTGLQNTAEEIHDIGERLLGLCQIALNGTDREDKALGGLLTETETNALGVLRNQFATTGRLSSARELSHALGYQSSSSGHLLLQRLMSKGILVRRAGQLTLAREYERRFEGCDHLPVFEN